METATPRGTLCEATKVPGRRARVSTSTPTDSFPQNIIRARYEDSCDLHVDTFERGSDDAEGDRSVLRVEGARRRCRRAVPETPLRNALTPLVHERDPTSRHGTDTPPEVTSPRTRMIHATAAFDDERAAGKPDKTVVGVAAACQRFLGAVHVERVNSARSRLARSLEDSAETGDDARRRGATNRPTRGSRGRKAPKTPTSDVENATRFSCGDSDFDSDDAAPSPFRRSDFAAAGVCGFTSISAALDDIDDRAGIVLEDLDDLEDLKDRRGTLPPPDALSPARIKKRRREAAASNLDATEPLQTRFGGDFVSAKRELDARLPSTLKRLGSDQSIVSNTGSVSDIELVAHRAFLQQELGDFVHQACAKRSADARREASHHGDGRVVSNLSAADLQPRTLDVFAGTKSQRTVQIVTPHLQRGEALETDHQSTYSPAFTGRNFLGDLFCLSQQPGDPGLDALRITDQFEDDLKHALEMELAC